MDFLKQWFGGRSINEKDRDGWTALMRAALKGNTGTVRRLIAKGANPNETDVVGVTALMASAQKGHLFVVQELLRNGANPNLSNRRGRSPLREAAAYGHSLVVEELLAHGAAPNVKDEEGKTPLMEAGDATVVRRLLQTRGVDVNACDKNGWTPLIRASFLGHATIVKLLLDHGADPTIAATGPGRSTALMKALQKGHTTIVQMLEAAITTKNQDVKMTTVNPEEKKSPVRDYLTPGEVNRFYEGDKSKAYYDQGTFLSQRGAYAEAEANFRKAIELNPGLAWAYCNLAVLLDDQGRHSEALDLIDRAISLDPHDSDFPERRREILENLRPGTPKADTKAESERLCREATVHFRSGQYQQALHCIEQALPMDEARLGRDSIVVAAHFKNRGMSLIALQRYQEAIDSYTTALSIFRQVEGPSGSQVALCLNDLGCAYLAMDDYCEALGHLQQAVALDQQLYGDQHPDTARHRANLARAQLGTRDTVLRAEAKHNLAQARNTLVRIVGPNHPDVRMIEQFERSAFLGG